MTGNSDGCLRKAKPRRAAFFGLNANKQGSVFALLVSDGPRWKALKMCAARKTAAATS